MKTPSSVLSALLWALSLAVGFPLSIPVAAHAGVVAGDFEAKLGNLLVKVAVTTAPGKSPVFSGRVLSGGTVRGVVTGSFNSGAKREWEGSIAVGGVREISLDYSSGAYESLKLKFADLEEEDGDLAWIGADQAYKPEGKATLAKAFSLAYQLVPTTNHAGVQLDVGEMDSAIAKSQSDQGSHQAVVEDCEKRLADKAVFVAEKIKLLVNAQQKYPDYYNPYNTAVDARLSATKAYDVARALAVGGMTGVFFGTKGLVTEGISFVEAATALVDGVKEQTDSIRAEVSAESPTAAAAEIAAKVASAKEMVVKLMTSKAAGYSTAVDRKTGRTPWVDRFEEYLAGFNSGGVKNLLPATFKGASIRTLFVKLGPHLNNVLDAAGRLQMRQVELDRLAPEYILKNPDFDPTEVELAQDEVDGAKSDLESTEKDLRRFKMYSAQSAAEGLELTAERNALSAGLTLLDFRGYGVASIAVTGRANSPGTALFTGVAPDGAKWTYAAKVLADQSGTPGEVHFSAMTSAGKAVEGDMALSGIVEGSAVAGTATKLTWSALMCEAVGPTLMTGVSKTKNPFGLSNKLRETTAVVALGEEALSDAGNNRFGLLLSSASAVKRYLSAEKGTELKVVLAPSVSFTGKFPYGGGGLVGFQGVFACPDSANPAVVEGFGQLLLNPTTSVPVKITVAEPADGSVPSPQLPVLQNTIVWKGLPSGIMTVQLDAPAERSLTTVALMRGTKAIATVVANTAGLASLDIRKVAAGDYTIKVMREHVKGVMNPVNSPSFKISQKAPPAGTFQCLLAYDALRGVVEVGQDVFLNGSAESVTPDGNPYRARLLVTTTPTGAWSGILEFIDLREVSDEAGNLAPDWSFAAGDGTQRRFKTRHPVLVEYRLNGSLVPSPEAPEGLACQVAIAPKDGAPALSLALLVADHALGGSFEKRTPATAVAGTLNATLMLEPAGAAPVKLSGSCQVASKGVPAAKGKYDAAGMVIDYSSGAATVSYNTMLGQENAGVKVTGSASIGRDGQIPLLLPPTLISRRNWKDTPASGSGEKIPGPLVSTAYGFLTAKLAASPGKKPPYGAQGVSLLYVTGSTLEEIPGGYRYNTVWAANTPDDGLRQGGFGSSKPVPVGVGP